MEIQNTIAECQISVIGLDQASELKAMETLLNEAFEVSEGQSYLDDFPVWGVNGPSSLHLGAYFKKGLVGCTMGRTCLLNLGHARTAVKIGLIGGVAIRPDHRGRGLASALVSKTAERLRAEGAVALFLWGSEHALYERLGFTLCGLQTRVALDDLILPSPTSVERVQEGWDERIGQALLDRTTGLRHLKEDLQWLRLHKNVHWFWIGDGYKAEAYAAIGRGIDLKNLVHEWGGHPVLLRQILSVVRKRFPRSELLGNTMELLKDFPEMSKVHPPQEFLTMGKILDVKTLQCAVSGLEVEENPKGSWNITLGGICLGGFDALELTRVLFGPSILPKEWEKDLPLPLWFWGLDAG